tara:strand:- start:159 stop:2855 length:2697 start_codon:yes stop_codon:yes gene_type:complete
MPSFDILGFRATQEGLLPGEKHLRAIKDFPLPRTVKEVQSFLGLVNFLRKFIPDCSKRQRALQTIIVRKKKGKVELNREEKEEFEGLKMAMQQYPALIHPDMRRPFYIHVDASGSGYGAILTQRTKDLPDAEVTKDSIPKGITKDHQVVCYASTALPKSHANYSNPEREASAIKWAIENFKHYILGKQVIIFTDHQTFEHSISHRPGDNVTSKNQVIAKCAAAVQRFDPLILHRPGKTMVIPDILSRIHRVDRVIDSHSITVLTRAQAKDKQKDSGSLEKPGNAPVTKRNQEQGPRDAREVSGRTSSGRASTEHLTSRKRKRTNAQNNAAVEGNQRSSDPLEPPKPRDQEHPNKVASSELQSEGANTKRRKRDEEKLLITQEKDPFCQLVRECLTEGRPIREHPDVSFVMRSLGRFYYDQDQILRINREHKEQRAHQVVLPRESWESTIDDYHEPPIAGHSKFEKLFALFSKRFWFKGMREFLKAYVQSCHKCQITKPSITYEGKAIPYAADFPNHIVHLDFTKGTGVAERGHTHILAIIDNFTNYLRLYPVKVVNAENAAKCLLEYVMTFSCPVKLVCDNGTEFSNALLKALSSALNISKCHISPYHSQSNGKVENAHRNIKTMLRAYIQHYVKDWDLLLPMLQLAHNAHISKATGYSPFYLMHGFPPILPTDIPQVQMPEYLTKDNYILKLQENLSEVFQFVRHHRALRMATREDAMDRKNQHKKIIFHPGQLVLMRSHAKQKKFNKKFMSKAQAEFFIVKEGCNDLYVLMDPHTMKSYPEKIHVGQLIRYNYRLSESEQQRLGTSKIAVQHLPTNRRTVDAAEGDNVHEVEEIRGAARMEDGTVMFQVKWKGYPFRPRNRNSWVEERDLYAPELLRRYKNTPEFQRLIQGEYRVT